jgi:putative DNA primase/helicase
MPHTPRHEHRIMLVRTSEIEPERITWIWPGIIASGRVTGLVGYPGLGKSQVAIDIAATVSTGREWPGGVANSHAGHVIILSAEDDVAHSIVPRLIAASANRDRIHVIKAIKGNDGAERAFNLALDLHRLEKEYDLRLVRLMMIDPVSAYLSTTTGRSVNRNYGADVRTILDRLAMFAARHDLGVLAITHLNKATGVKAIRQDCGVFRVGSRAAGRLSRDGGNWNGAAPVLADQKQSSAGPHRLCIRDRRQDCRRRYSHLCGRVE